jgi:serine/threonine-protein kinase RsbW
MTAVAPTLSAGEAPEAGCVLPLTLDAGPADVELARRAVVEFLAPFGLSPQAAYAVELVLEEVLMNIAWHAYEGQEPRQASVAVRIDRDEVLMCFEDDGRAFDPTRHEEEPPPATLPEARPGGLGLRLVRRHARHIGYQRLGGRNRLTVGIARQ